MSLSTLLCFYLGILAKASTGHQLLVLSFDGFRYDYFGQVPTPNLDYVAKTGVHAKDGMQAVFTTKTFPSHWSLVTGLYEESHGIIDNDMYDPVFDEKFHFGGPSKWWGGEPIWVTAKRQGKKVGVYFWPGSEVEINGIRPDYYYAYNESTPFERRIGIGLNWLTEEKLDLVLLYYNEPDSSGHKFGAASGRVMSAIKDIDVHLGTVISHLKDAATFDTTNILIVSDHGMANTTTPVIALNKYVSEEEINRIQASKAIAMIEPKSKDATPIISKLKAADESMDVYAKDDIPDRYHYKHNRRISQILLVAQEGHLIYKNQPKAPSKGNHGYDNALPSMRPIFVARGPDFKVGQKIGLFESVNVYLLMCKLLGIEAAPNNGTLSTVNQMLKSSGTQNRPPIFICAQVLTIFIFKSVFHT